MDQIRYCVVDNDNGTVCYCHTEQQAKDVVAALELLHKVNVPLIEESDYFRFAYEDMREYSHERLEEIRQSIPKKKVLWNS